MKNFSEDELQTVLRFTNHLADQQRGASFADAKTTADDLMEAEREARAYAEARNKGKRARSDYGATEADKSITAGVREWLARQRKRGHKV